MFIGKNDILGMISIESFAPMLDMMIKRETPFYLVEFRNGRRFNPEDYSINQEEEIQLLVMIQEKSGASIVEE